MKDWWHAEQKEKWHRAWKPNWQSSSFLYFQTHQMDIMWTSRCTRARIAFPQTVGFRMVLWCLSWTVKFWALGTMCTWMISTQVQSSSQTCLLWSLVLVGRTETRGRTSRRLQLSHCAGAPAGDPSGGFGTGLLCVWSGWTRKWCPYVPPSMLPIQESACKGKSKHNIHGRQSLFHVLHLWLHTTSTWGVLTCPISCCSTTLHSTKPWSGTEKSSYTSWTLPPTTLSYCTKSCLATWLPISSWKSLLQSSVAYHRKQHQKSLAQTMCQFQELSWLQTSEELLPLVAGSVCIAKQCMERSNKHHGNAWLVTFTCVFSWTETVSRNGTKVCDC